MTAVFLGLGCNQGMCRVTLAAAVSALEAGGVRLIRRSSLYETAPIGPIAQPWFLNAVVEGETAHSPDALLDLIATIEIDLGRTRDIRWGPRAIDIDILLYGEVTITTERLVIPHREMTKRRFVLAPLAEIRPDLMLPDGRTVAALLHDLQDETAVRRLDAPW